MSRGARLAISAALVATSLAAWSQVPARKGAPASARAPAAASAPPAASAPAAASAATEFSGALVTGTTYVADMAFDARALKIWRPLKEVQPGKDVAWTIAWTNLDQFPALKSAATQAKPQRFRFRVAKTDMVSGSPQLPWMVTYRCEILAVEPIAAVAQAPPRRR
jgi:hypothetical protein